LFWFFADKVKKLRRETFAKNRRSVEFIFD